ncbi:uncharacterized protein LOC117487889 [Trematomus bernacchii]|uniref:uncharacterized protein LOC117487889 n=1 Tax=Trematomus bernacchii TaxID=40690 RepID=UPI001469EF9C|nr:uncharacterized protein LOC117487889 [Trematomus bernacchii]
MYLWRFSIAITLGLVWYFSCGRSVTQYILCIFFCFSSSLLFENSGRESSTQTDEETVEHPFQEAAEGQLFGDLCDFAKSSVHAEPLESQYPHVKKSLQQVFECAYAQLVLPWYGVPEQREQQPLHKVLSGEFNFVIDRIIDRAKDFDVCQAVVASVPILTQHLHNAKQADRELLFSSRAEEIAVLRVFSDALVRNLFPKPLWGHEVNRCALYEIVALKGLGLLVTWLSDPDNLNQMVVNQLDRVTPKANKLKEGWSKFVDKVKSKKAKKKKMERRVLAPNEDEVDGRECSLHSPHDSDREDSDLETSVQEDMMIRLLYEMWRAGSWAVSIPHAEWDGEELIFTFHLEEKGSPENLQWDIKKTYMDVIYFRNRWQDSTSLPTILLLQKWEVNAEVKEEARVSVEHFLQALVSANLISQTQPVFQFLCPLDKLLNEEEHYGGVWGLLSGLAYFLTPGQEEEESSSPQTEAPKDIITPFLHPESTALPSETAAASTEEGSDVPDGVITSPRRENLQGQKSQVNLEQLEATEAIFDLLKEISGNSIRVKFVAFSKRCGPFLKWIVNSFLDKMNPTELQMAGYIDTLRNNQWPEIKPAAPHHARSEEEKSETRDRAHGLINARYYYINLIPKKDMEAVFNLFQDREGNQTLVYMLLSYLMRKFLPNDVSVAALQKVTTSPLLICEFP